MEDLITIDEEGLKIIQRGSLLDILLEEEEFTYLQPDEEILDYPEVPNIINIAGQQLVPKNKLAVDFQNVFGDGSDGNVEISSYTELTRDMYYNNLTVKSNYTLNSKGYRIFVKNTLTIEVNGAISRNGNNGGNGTNANGPYGPGTGGAGGPALPDGSIKGAVAGKDGKIGGTGGYCNGGSVGGENGPDADGGEDVAKSIGSEANPGSGGGTTYGSYKSGPGAGGPAGAKTGTVFNKPYNALAAYLLYDVLPAGDPLKSSPGPGGCGGGGGGGACRSGASTGKGGDGGGGGGSASPGGMVLIFARTIVNKGIISVEGGNGGNGGTGGNGVATGTDAYGNGGGGGGAGTGGPGGALIIVYLNYSGSGTKSVAGGSKGTPGPGGIGDEGSANSYCDSCSNGNPGGAIDGNPGQLIELQL